MNEEVTRYKTLNSRKHERSESVKGVDSKSARFRSGENLKDQ